MYIYKLYSFLSTQIILLSNKIIKIIYVILIYFMLYGPKSVLILEGDF